MVMYQMGHRFRSFRKRLLSHAPSEGVGARLDAGASVCCPVDASGFHSRWALSFFGGLGLGGVLLTGACTTPPSPPPPSPMAPLEKLLVTAAQQSADAVRALAEVETTVTPPVRIDDQDIPDILRRPVSLNWVGPLGPAVSSVAKEIGYHFIETGRSPSSPIIVDIHATNRPVYQVLQDLGLQAGTRADVAINGTSRQVEIRYAP